jgi:magnesium transporter
MAIINPISILKKSLFERKIGTSPGEYIYVGKKLKEVKITLVKYDSDSGETIEIKNFDHLIENLDDHKNNWINLDGVGDVELMTKISLYFKFDKLMAEDIMNTEHLPKSEEFDEHLFSTLKMVWLEKLHDKVQITKEHVSLVLGKNYVLSFQDSIEGDVFDSVRQRIKSGKGQIRKKGADYLFYALADTIVDHFFLVMEYMREQIEDLEDYVLTDPKESMIEEISSLRRKISEMRRMIHMIHEAVKKIITEESDFIDESTNPYLKDVLDHTNHLNNNFDSFRDYISNIMDMYMSNMSNNLNVILKTLTIFSLFFVPLTFIAGIYGMNFQNMPELGYAWGYPMVLGFMIVITLIMFFYMRRKRWF